MLQHAGIPLPPLAIELAHRVEVKQKHSDRAILVTFLHMGDRDDVLLRQEQIYHTCRIMVEEDFPPDIDAKRRKLHPFMRAINKPVTGKQQNRASLWDDKLIVDGKHYTVETLDKLPTDISTEKLSTPRKNNMVVFFSKYSPLSNYYKSEELVDGKIFSCQEQHYTYHKAKTFGDTETAKKIMKTKNPVEMKNLGKHIKQFDYKVWSNNKVEVMRAGLEAKLKNEKLRQFLLDTEDATLMVNSINSGGLAYQRTTPESGDKITGMVVHKI